MTPADEADIREQEVVVECEMDASPETVWRALTEEELAADWLGARPAGEGGDAADGPCYRIVEIQPYSRVRYAWHDPDCPDAPPTVTIELERLSGGNTWFRLRHGEVAASTRMAANTNRPPLARAA